MKIDILAAAASLSDAALLARLNALAGVEREASAELVAHLAELDARPAVYAAQGHGSLFAYCTQALRLSEDAACNRIEAARACRRFPLILDHLSSGALSLTSVRILGRHLTQENHEAVLARARGRSRREIDALVAELAPRPDTTPSVRRLPTAIVKTAAPTPSLPTLPLEIEAPTIALPQPSLAETTERRAPAPVSDPLPLIRPAEARPIVQATAPRRYRVQFAIDEKSYEKLRRLQALLRREVPDGNPAAICDRAWTVLLEKVEKEKLGVVANPRRRQAIRPGTDKVHGSTSHTRHIPHEVKRTVWKRDGGQCAFVSAAGLRCRERTFLEFHHLKPFAWQGPATVGNISLRCRRHNQYESERIFGPYGTSVTREDTRREAPR
jgi:hypothetical protein